MILSYSRSTTVQFSMTSGTGWTEKGTHSLCKLHTHYLCISPDIHKILHMSPYGDVPVPFRPVTQNPPNSAGISLLWPAATHPTTLQLSFTLLSAHSVTCGHTQMKKAYLVHLFCELWIKTSRGLQNHTVTTHCSTQASLLQWPESVLQLVLSNCWLPTEMSFHLFSVPRIPCHGLSTVLQLVIVQPQGKTVQQAVTTAVCQKRVWYFFTQSQNSPFR